MQFYLFSFSQNKNNIMLHFSNESLLLYHLNAGGKNWKCRAWNIKWNISHILSSKTEKSILKYFLFCLTSWKLEFPAIKSRYLWLIVCRWVMHQRIILIFKMRATLPLLSNGLIVQCRCKFVNFWFCLDYNISSTPSISIVFDF